METERCISTKIKRAWVLVALFIIVVAVPNYLYAQAPGIEWQKCLGGSQDDVANCIIQTTDGGFVIAGYTQSKDGDASGLHGLFPDAWVVKLDASHNIEWQKCYGGDSTEVAYSIIQTKDGGYAFTGYTNSNSGDVHGNHGGNNYYDVWVVKLNSKGSIEWQKTLGGSNDDTGESIIQTFDDGFVIAGYTSSNDGDVTGFHDTLQLSSSTDAWIIKLDSKGNIKWEKCVGGRGRDNARSIIQIAQDGGYIFAGTTTSHDEGFFNHGNADAWVVKLNSYGDFEWQKCYGGSDVDGASTIIETADGGYAFVGNTNTIASGGDVSGNHGYMDFWVVKLDYKADIVWQKCLGGTGYDVGSSITNCSDGGLAVAGLVESSNGDVTGNHSTYPTPMNAWVTNLNSSGVLQWEKCLGGTKQDEALSIIQTTDGEFAVAGRAGSTDGDVSGHHGSNNDDAWIVKLRNPLGVQVSSSFSDGIHLSSFPNPASKSTTLFFDLPKSSPVEIVIYNAMGERKWNIQESEYESGHHETPVDLGGLPNGTCFVRLKAGDVIQTCSFQIMR